MTWLTEEWAYGWLFGFAAGAFGMYLMVLITRCKNCCQLGDCDE